MPAREREAAPRSQRASCRRGLVALSSRPLALKHATQRADAAVLPKGGDPRMALRPGHAVDELFTAACARGRYALHLGRAERRALRRNEMRRSAASARGRRAAPSPVRRGRADADVARQRRALQLGSTGALQEVGDMAEAAWSPAAPGSSSSGKRMSRAMAKPSVSGVEPANVERHLSRPSPAARRFVALRNAHAFSMDVDHGSAASVAALGTAAHTDVDAPAALEH